MVVVAVLRADGKREAEPLSAGIRPPTCRLRLDAQNLSTSVAGLTAVVTASRREVFWHVSPDAYAQLRFDSLGDEAFRETLGSSTAASTGPYVDDIHAFTGQKPTQSSPAIYHSRVTEAHRISTRNARTNRPIRLWHVGLWIVFASLAIGLLICLFTFVLRGSFVPWQLEKPLEPAELQQIVQSAVTSAAALGLGITLYLSFRRQKSADDSYLTTLELLRLQQDQHRSDSITTLRDRYVSAADQFGSDARPIRLVGIYALSSLADDWSEERNVKERQVCIDLLTSYLALGADDTDTVETRGPEWQTIWSTIFERAVLERNNPGWAGANVRIRNIMLRSRLTGLRFDYGYLSFSASPVSMMIFEGCHFELSEVTFDTLQWRQLHRNTTHRTTSFTSSRQLNGASFSVVRE